MIYEFQLGFEAKCAISPSIIGCSMGGSGKRKLAEGSHLLRNAIGKLRRLRLPLPPVPNALGSSQTQRVNQAEERLTAG